MMKKAFVNGEEIPQEAVQHEFDRLARLYLENGMSADELKQNVEKLLGLQGEQGCVRRCRIRPGSEQDPRFPASCRSWKGAVGIH